MTTETSWEILRSDIYIRDRGMCWICNAFVPLHRYELGHIIDRTNGGHDDYDNLAVMHMDCNRAKPYHKTLEEAVKWKLTAFLPIKAPAAQSHRHPTHIKRVSLPKNTEKQIIYTTTERTAEEQGLYNEQIKKIKPATICWKQGNPLAKGGGFAPMYRLLPPPYQQQDMFTMRETPLGYNETKVSGLHSISKTLQVIGGTLQQDVSIKLGIVNIYIHPTSNDLRITFKVSAKANSKERSKTVGMGEGQIPIEVWNKAKGQGISLEALIASRNLK